MNSLYEKVITMINDKCRKVNQVGLTECRSCDADHVIYIDIVLPVTRHDGNKTVQSADIA